MKDIYLSPKQVAEIVGVSVKTVWNWVNTGKITAFKIGGGRNLRIRGSDLNSFMVKYTFKPECAEGDGHQTEQAEV